MLKKVWLTPIGTRSKSCSLSLESSNPGEVVNRLQVSQNLFPSTPDDKNPLRFTTVLNVFTEEDLYLLMETINKYLME